MAKAPAPKPKKEKNPPPVEDDEDDDLQKDEEKEDSKKGGGKLNLKLILMIAGAVLVTAGLTAGLMMFLVGGGSPPPPATEVSAEGSGSGEHVAPPVAPQRSSGGHGAPPAESGGGGGGHGGDGEAGLAEPGAPVNIKFESFIVNLNDLGGRRMLKLTMSVDADNKDLADEINAKMPQFRDTILLLLSSIQSDDISGIDGKQRLKNQMLNRINPNLTRGKIRNLYFSEIVVQ